MIFMNVHDQVNTVSINSFKFVVNAVYFQKFPEFCNPSVTYLCFPSKLQPKESSCISSCDHLRLDLKVPENTRMKKQTVSFKAGFNSASLAQHNFDQS